VIAQEPDARAVDPALVVHVSSKTRFRYAVLFAPVAKRPIQSPVVGVATPAQLAFTEPPAGAVEADAVSVVGGTVKLAALVAVPAAVVTVIVPLVAPAGTVATSQVSQTTAKAAGVPLNFTEVAPARYVPRSATLVPAPPEAGETLVSVGVLW
jgi:hypothetical protein